MKLLFLILIFGGTYSFGQNSKIDSLKIALINKPNDVGLNLKLAKQFIYSNPDSSFRYAKRVIDIGNPIFYSQGYDIMGNSFISRSKIDSARFYYNKALNYVNAATNQNKEHNRIGRLLNLTQVSIFEGKSGNALDTLSLIESTVSNWEDSDEKTRDLMIVFSTKANVLISLGRQDQAIEYLYKSIKMTQIAKDENGEAACWSRVARIFTSMSKFNKAIETHKRVLYLASKNGNRKALAGSYSNIGSNFLKLNNIDSAIFYNYMAINNTKGFNIATENVRDLLLTGKIELAMNLNEKAISNFQNALINNSNNEVTRANIGVFIGDAYANLKNWDSSKKYYNIALPVYLNEKLDDDLKDVKFKLLNLKLKENNRLDLASVLSEYDSISKVEIEKEQVNAVVASEIKFETAEKEATILTQNNKLVTERKQKNWLWWGIVSLSSILFGLSYLYKRMKKQKAQIQNQRQEILHNNRNNIQQLISIFSMQAENEKDSKVLIANQERLYTLNLLNKLLYENSDSSKVSINKFVNEISNAKQISCGNKVAIHIECPNIILSPNLMKDIGLIINEITTNAIKYAFVDISEPKINIEIIEAGNTLKLNLSDNGNGLPSNFNFNKTFSSFGLEFIKDLVQQYNGTINAYNNNGARFDIELKV